MSNVLHTKKKGFFLEIWRNKIRKLGSKKTYMKTCVLSLGTAAFLWSKINKNKMSTLSDILKT